ncbi:MAG: arginase family protein [Rhodobacteraceae bacterium]|jgi:agmatinase|nr:arginase family protein [Paracoccaceae bacterium]
MTDTRTIPIAPGMPRFLGAPACASVDDLDAPYAVIGAPFGYPYTMRNVAGGASDAPAALRARSHRYGDMQDRYDIDLGGLPFAGKPHPVRDLGDVLAEPGTLDANSERVSAVVARVLERGARPIILGGDDSTTWMAIRGFRAQAPVTVVQFDAHIDFRDEVGGIREGYSSPMRRASEAPWVERILHVGGRGLGSARAIDQADTLAAGNAVITAREVRAKGARSVLDLLAPGSRVYIAFDVDGIDPSEAPGTSAPLPGGLSFPDAQDIFMGLAAQHEIVGMNVAEHFPGLDVNGITSLLITRLIASWIGVEMNRP